MKFKKYVAVVIILLFIGLAFAPTINANVERTEADISKDTIPLELQYQWIIDKIKSINLQNFLFDIDAVVDTLEEVSTTLEENDELRAYIQMQSDCRCGGTTEWRFPVICFFLAYAFIFVGTLLILGLNLSLLNLYKAIEDLEKELNCRWV